MLHFSGDARVFIAKLVITALMLWASVLTYRRKDTEEQTTGGNVAVNSPLGLVVAVVFGFFLNRIFKKIPNKVWALVPLAVAIWIWTIKI